MNEEFLYRLRAEPPREFAVRLKVKLDRQTRRSDSTRSRIIRALAAVSLIGASAHWSERIERRHDPAPHGADAAITLVAVERLR